MEFKQAVVTQNGRALMAKLLAGKSTQFTKIKVSSTIYPDAQLANLTALTNIEQETTAQAYGNNTATVSVVGAIENTGLTSGYYINTVGLYAVDPDKGEILYSVSSASVNGYMPPDTGVSKSGFEFKIYTEVGNATKVDLTVDPAAFATHEDIERLGIQQAWSTNENGDVSNTFGENLLTDTLPNNLPKLDGRRAISGNSASTPTMNGVELTTLGSEAPYYFVGVFNANPILSEDLITKIKGNRLIASAKITFENANSLLANQVGISIYYWRADGSSYNPNRRKTKFEAERIWVDVLIPEDVTNVLVAVRGYNTSGSENSWPNTKIIFDKIKLEIASDEVLLIGPPVYTPAIIEDPINCYPKYVGFGIKSSDNYQDYRWILNPDWAIANAMYGTSIVTMKDQLADIQDWIQAHS